MFSFKKTLKFCTLLSAVLFFSSFDDGFKTTPSGLQYKIIAHSTLKPKVKVEEGSIVKFRLTFQTDKDSVLDVQTAESVVKNEPSYEDRASVMEALQLLHKGDSALFRINSDQIFGTNPSRPEYLASGRFLCYTIKVEDVKTQAQVDAEEKQAYKNLKEKQDAEIAKYAKEHNLHLTTTASGLRYELLKSVPNGPNAKTGDIVSVHYTGTLLNGTQFDSSLDRGQPITFPVNTQRVIRGWDEGLQKLKAGEKAVFVIPSELAYGKRGMGSLIPENSVLVFYIEVVSIEPK